MKLRLKKAAYPGNAISWSKKYKYGFIYFKGWVLTVDLTKKLK